MARECGSPDGPQGHIFVRVEVVSLEVDSNGEIRKCAGAGNTDDFAAQIFDRLGLLAAEKRVVRIVGLRGDDVDVQAFGPAANRRLGAADAGEVDIAGDQTQPGRWARRAQRSVPP